MTFWLIAAAMTAPKGARSGQRTPGSTETINGSPTKNGDQQAPAVNPRIIPLASRRRVSASTPWSNTEANSCSPARLITEPNRCAAVASTA